MRTKAETTKGQDPCSIITHILAVVTACCQTIDCHILCLSCYNSFIFEFENISTAEDRLGQTS